MRTCRFGPSRRAPSECFCPSTLVVFESPYRVLAALKDLVAALGPERPVAVGRELTKRFEEVFRGTAAASLAYFSERAPRGEFTLAIGGNGAPVPETTP